MFHIVVSTKGSHQERTVESEWKVDDRYHPVEGDSSGEVLAKWEGAVLIGRRVTETGIEETRFTLEPGSATLTESIQFGANVTILVWRHK